VTASVAPGCRSFGSSVAWATMTTMGGWTPAHRSGFPTVAEHGSGFSNVTASVRPACRGFIVSVPGAIMTTTAGWTSCSRDRVPSVAEHGQRV